MAREKMDPVVLIPRRVSEGRHILWQTLHKNEVIVPGDYVQVGFKFNHPDTGNEGTEHMWMVITKVDGNKLTGILDCDPKFVTTFNYKDVVTIDFDQIENHLKGK